MKIFKLLIDTGFKAQGSCLIILILVIHIFCSEIGHYYSHFIDKDTRAL